MSPLSRIIAEEIRLKGPISMARFMELALYCPDYGYYERDADNIGARGDFQTSVSVGPMFGELLAVQFSSWLDQLQQSKGGKLHLIEAGAHDGQLAADILNWFQSRRPELLSGIHYHLLEPSKKRREWQRAKLMGFAGRIKWSSSFDDLKQGDQGVNGIILSNELLDALPVHRFVWCRHKQSWSELLVDQVKGVFVWRGGGDMDKSHQEIIDALVPEELHRVLPDGHIVEYSPLALEWWERASSVLECGCLLTFDYGISGDGMITPDRVGGTLRSYRRHQALEEVLSSPGEQDITAHVRFDLVQKIGEEHGLKTEFWGEQGRFLVDVINRADAKTLDAAKWTAAQKRQFKSLMHPNHFGHSFKVLVQSKWRL